MGGTYQARTLREWIHNTHTSQRDLAKKVGCHQTMISALVRGDRAARGKLATRIYRATGVKVETLVIRARPRRGRRQPGGAKKR